MAVRCIESLAGALWVSVGGEGHKTIKSAKETLPVKPNEAAAIISGLDWHCPAARPDSERHAGSWLRGRDEQWHPSYSTAELKITRA